MTETTPTAWDRMIDRAAAAHEKHRGSMGGVATPWDRDSAVAILTAAGITPAIADVIAEVARLNAVFRPLPPATWIKPGAGYNAARDWAVADTATCLRNLNAIVAGQSAPKEVKS